MERVEINRVGKRERELAQQERKRKVGEGGRKLQSDRISVWCVFEALTHLLAHREP